MTRPRPTRKSTAPPAPEAAGNVACDRLLTAEEVAERLRVPPSWVLRQAREGRLPSVRLGHYVRFRPEAIAAWVADQEVGP